MEIRVLLIITAIFLTASNAIGHEVPKGPHGGRVVEAGQVHVELVAKDNVVEVYLTNNADKALPANGYKGVAILLIGGKSQRITLEPASDNLLIGKATEALKGAPKGAVRLTAPDGKTSQAQFN